MNSPSPLDLLLIRTKAELERQWSTKQCFCPEIKDSYRYPILKQSFVCVCLWHTCCICYCAETVKEKLIHLHFPEGKSTLGDEVTCLSLLTQLHLIHWNSTLFGNIDEAVGKPHGIAIIALFVQVNGPLLWLSYCSEWLISNSLAEYFLFTLTFIT